MPNLSVLCGPVVSRRGTDPAAVCSGSTRGAAVAVWVAAGAIDRDWAKANGEADPAEAPPKERSGTDEGTPLVGLSGAPKGG